MKRLLMAEEMQDHAHPPFVFIMTQRLDISSSFNKDSSIGVDDRVRPGHPLNPTEK